MEIYQEFGNDLVLTDAGDLLTADGITLTNQRIIRRLLTTPIPIAPVSDYLQQPTYGAGLSYFIGQKQTPEIINQITRTITAQMYLENTVSQNPPPTIQISGLPNVINCTITYNYVATNTQVVLQFEFPPDSSNG